MDKLKYIKLENEDGSYSNSIPLAVDSDHVDVNGNTLTNELNYKANNSSINNLQNQINSLASGSPLVASSISGMTDTTRVYVNTSDGYWYYYDGETWQSGGIYEATSNNKIVENLNELLGNININKNDWEVGGFKSDGDFQENNSAIRYLCEIPTFVEKAVLNTTNYKLYIIKRLIEEPRTITREEVVSPFTFDHEHYYYNVYLLQNPTSQSATIDDYNKLFLYANINNLYNVLLNNSNIEEQPNYKYYKTIKSDFESGIISGSGSESPNIHGIRYKGFIDTSISKVKILDKNSSCNLVITRYRRSDDTFVDRLSFYKEYNDFNHEIYKYKVYIVSQVGIKTPMYWNILFYTSQKLNNYNNYLLNYYYDEDSSTYYSLLRINKTKYDGKMQYPFVYAPHGATGTMESTLSMMLKNNFEVGINAGIAAVSAGTNIPWGIIIENGQIIKSSIDDTHEAMPLTIDNSGTLGYAEYDADATELVNNGIISAVVGWYPIIDNFQKITNINFNGISGNADSHAQRQIIGQFGNGDYAIITCEGRGFNNSIGWTIDEAQSVCEKLNLKFAYNLDGGGSVETVMVKKQINTIYEQTTGRAVQNYIIFTGDTIFPSE